MRFRLKQDEKLGDLQVQPCMTLVQTGLMHGGEKKVNPPIHTPFHLSKVLLVMKRERWATDRS